MNCEGKEASSKKASSSAGKWRRGDDDGPGRRLLYGLDGCWEFAPCLGKIFIDHLDHVCKEDGTGNICVTL